jgi:biopolymer transport protein ExbD
MHDRMRLVFAGCFVLALFGAVPARSKPPASKEVEYKRADSNFYFTRDVKASDPDAVILPETSFRQQDGSWFYVPHRKAPHEIYVKEMADWLEPVTPPSMPLTPEGLGIAPDAMQIREPQGDVTIALPDNPSNFFPATDRMAVPDGAIVKTGADGTTAVLLGGVNSLRLAPNSQASVEQTVTPDLRSTRVDLKSGAAFSKVGLRPGAAQDYEVRTEAGTVKVKGTDFLTVVGAGHTNVFLVQGVVEFDGPDGHRLALAKSNGSGEPQLIQSELAARGGKGTPPPVIGEATMAFDFIPTVNVKVKALREKEAAGTTLTPEEKQYLSLLRRVPVLVKLARVEPPAPPPQEPAAAVAAPAPPPAPAPPAPEKEVVKKAPVAEPVAEEKPAPRTEPVTEAETPPPSEPETLPPPAVPAGMAHIEGGELVTPVDLSTPGEKMTTTESAPKPKPAKPAKMAKTTPAAQPAPAVASTKPKAPPVVKVSSAKPTPSSKPLKATLHADGMVDFRGQTLPTAQFETKLKEVMATRPHKTLLLHAANDVPFADIKELIDAGKEAGLQEVKLVPDATKTSTGTAAITPAPLAPAQAMKTEALMVPRPVVPPSTQATVPDAPAEDTAAAATAPAPAGPISPVKNDTVP